ncbi:hypothetical protein N8E89_19065 (plasmid) [Phyllobacterium sp. A18/5-2]|uniref:hypothetical protein n=1 Tax=Phyllobacterium sp. A18/5-2 TaxID=2978392 RepID=UPI0021C8019C|nr:hypothetical protein [Phyllobacterium sp. A18/5-2]UXN66718.1 hypothetical protein N8E89_19065 [Phyllobacterium sp. A18/5-2]
MSFWKKTVPLCGCYAVHQRVCRYESGAQGGHLLRATPRRRVAHVDRYARRHAHGSSFKVTAQTATAAVRERHVGDERQSRKICCPQTPQPIRNCR